MGFFFEKVLFSLGWKMNDFTLRSAGSSLFRVYRISLFIYAAKFVHNSFSICLLSISRFSDWSSDSTLLFNDSNLFSNSFVHVRRKFEALYSKFCPDSGCGNSRQSHESQIIL